MKICDIFTRGVLCFFVIYSPFVLASWELVAKNDHGLEVYGDRSRVRLKGQLVLGWELQNIPDAWLSKLGDKPPYLSSAFLKAHNCVEGTSAVTYETRYERQMANGAAVFLKNIPETEWEFSPYPPGSPGEALRDFYCKELLRRIQPSEPLVPKQKPSDKDWIRM